jgi:ATP-dependent DNA helicase RecG
MRLNQCSASHQTMDAEAMTAPNRYHIRIRPCEQNPYSSTTWHHMATRRWVEDALQALRESLHPVPAELNELDWKAALSPQRERLVEHLIALANLRNGGTLVYGIDNHGHAVGVDATAVADALNQLANLGRDAVEPPLAIDHAVVAFDGTSVLLVHVPEQAVKPAHRRGRPLEDTWVRSGGTTRRASRQEVGALMLDSSPPRWEQQRASGLLSLEEVQGLLDLPTVARLLQRPLPEEPEHLSRWLVEEGLALADGRGLYITNFGAIAAARRLDDFAALARKSLRLVRYRGTNKVETIEEVPGQRGYAVGFEALIGDLQRVLPHSEVIAQALRVETTVFPEIALRELIANALIHQDFSITGAGPMVELFDDRITITNPGSLLPGKRPDRLIGTTPESRNEQLASSFRRDRICEERGTGFQKVVQAIELFGLPALQVEPLETALRVTLSAPLKFTEMGLGERIEACYQHAVLQYVSSRTLTNTTLRERFKLGEKQRNSITNLIAAAAEAGRIKRKDQGSGNKFAEYLPYWA